MKLFIFLVTSVFLSCGAAHNEPVCLKSLALLALKVALQNKEFVSSDYRRSCIDLYLANALISGDLQLEDIPDDFKNPLPITSECVAQELIAQGEIEYNQRDRVVETGFGLVLEVGSGFVKDRAKFFETMHKRPEVARLIEKKQRAD